jgi:hypothetical protein
VASALALLSDSLLQPELLSKLKLFLKVTNAGRAIYLNGP